MYIRKLQSYIWQSFYEVARPDTTQIVPEHCCEECSAIAAALAPFSAVDLPPKLVDELFQCLSLLSPKALHYYIPAFMCRSLVCPGSLVFEFTLYQLAFKETDEHHLTRFSALG